MQTKTQAAEPQTMDVDVFARSAATGTALPIKQPIGEGIDLSAPDAAQQIERRFKFQREVVAALIRVYGPSGWVDHGGKPYLMGVKAEVMLGALGVRFTGWRFERSVHDRTVKAEDGTPRTEQITGWDVYAEARKGDLHLGEYYGYHAEEGYTPEQPDARKGAQMNLYHRAADYLCGTGALTWEDLEKLGIPKGAGGAVEYKKGGRGGKSDAGAVVPEDAPVWKAFYGKARALGWDKPKTEKAKARLIAKCGGAGVTLGVLREALDKMEAQIQGKAGAADDIASEQPQAEQAPADDNIPDPSWEGAQ